MKTEPARVIPNAGAVSWSLLLVFTGRLAPDRTLSVRAAVPRDLVRVVTELAGAPFALPAAFRTCQLVLELSPRFVVIVVRIVGVVAIVIGFLLCRAVEGALP